MHEFSTTVDIHCQLCDERINDKDAWRVNLIPPFIEHAVVNNGESISVCSDCAKKIKQFLKSVEKEQIIDKYKDKDNA